MISLVDLQSALRLLSAPSQNKPGKTNPADQPLNQIVSNDTSNTKPPITGAGSQPSSLSVYSYSVDTTLTVKNGVVSGTFTGEGSGAGAAAFIDNAFYKDFEAELTDYSMTDQQLTDAVYSNAAVSRGESGGSQTFMQTLEYGETIGAYSSQYVGSIVSAMDSHDLQIQNVVTADPGFAIESAGHSANGSSSGSWSETDDFSSMLNTDDGKQHAIMTLGYAWLYLTW